MVLGIGFFVGIGISFGIVKGHPKVLVLVLGIVKGYPKVLGIGIGFEFLVLSISGVAAATLGKTVTVKQGVLG